MKHLYTLNNRDPVYLIAMNVFSVLLLSHVMMMLDNDNTAVRISCDNTFSSKWFFFEWSTYKLELMLFTIYVLIHFNCFQSFLKISNFLETLLVKDLQKLEKFVWRLSKVFSKFVKMFTICSNWLTLTQGT